MARDQIQMTDALYDYMWGVSGREPELLARLRAETAGDAFSFFQISPVQGQFMRLLVELLKPRRILEVGVYTGYSSTSMAMAMPQDGRIVALDLSDEWTSIARRYWKEAGVEDRIELRLGPAADTMDGLIAEGAGDSFDLCFVDADKTNYWNYYERALKLVKKGGLIIFDNTLFSGRVIGLNSENLQPFQVEYNEAVKAFNERLHKDERVTLAMIPVGDGMTFAIRK